MPRTFHAKNPQTLANLGTVKTESLVPCQQPTRPEIVTSADCYLQRCLKFPDTGIFHSYEEYLYALLLEADPEVKSFVPQPFKLRINRTLYTPDFYVFRTDREYVLELKPRGEMDESLKTVVAEFFDFHNMQFKAVANEDVRAREIEARHWQPVVQILVCANKYQLETGPLEHNIWQKCLSFLDDPVIGDLLPLGHQDSEGLHDVALYRLIHRHRLSVDLSKQPLSYDTVLHRCV